MSVAFIHRLRSFYISEMDLLTIGCLLDMYSELQADDVPPVYTASQDDMDKF